MASTELRVAAQQALEALQDFKLRGHWGDFDNLTGTLQAALVEDAMQKFTDVNQELEAALAEPVEPVAWRFEARHIDSAWAAAVTLKHPGAEGVYMRNVVPLYAAPPQRKPLTEEDIWRTYKNLWMFHPAEEPRLAGDVLKFARAIERAHGIGGQP